MNNVEARGFESADGVFLGFLRFEEGDVVTTGIAVRGVGRRDSPDDEQRG